MSVQERSFLTALWDFFCSLKLTVITLILLAITSIIGTVIQQNLSPQEYLQIYGETTYRILNALQIFDMYHSWWFLTLLGVFSINLTACSIKRLPRVWKTVKKPTLAPTETLYRSLSNMEEFAISAPVSEVKERLAAQLGQEFAAPVVTEEEDRVHLFAQKGAWSRFGVYVTHLSILIVFLGAIIGNLFGYKAFVNIVEETGTDQIWPRQGNQPIKLGFTVRCEDFSVSYYEGTGRPKEFKSLLSVIDNGQKVIDGRPVVVNSPLTYKGITFYQSSYGPAGDPTFRMRVRVRATGETLDLAVRQGQRAELPGGGSFRVVDFAPSFQNFGPAAKLEVVPSSGSRRTFVVLQAYPEFDAQRGGEYIFSLLDYQQRQYTGLQVAKDPGVWVVWTGCLLMVLGFWVAFFLSHRRVWVTILPLDGGRTGVMVGGSAHRNQPAFEGFFDDLKKKLKTELAS